MPGSNVMSFGSGLLVATNLAAQATQHFHAQLNAEMPQIEETTHATAERVQVVYRDNPVPAVCKRPAGVLQQLEAARERANAAASTSAH